MPLSAGDMVAVASAASEKLAQPKSKLLTEASYDKVRPACSKVIGAIRAINARGNPAHPPATDSPLYKLLNNSSDQDFCVGVPVDSLQRGTFKSRDLKRGVKRDVLVGRAACPGGGGRKPLYLYQDVVCDVAQDGDGSFVVGGEIAADAQDLNNDKHRHMVVINSSDWQAQAERVFCVYDATLGDEKKASEILMARINHMRGESPQCGDTTLTSDECELLATKMAVAGPSRVYIGDNGEVLRCAKLNVAFHNTTPRLNSSHSPHAVKLCKSARGFNSRGLLQFNGNDGAMQYALEFGNSAVQICEGMRYMCSKGDIECSDDLALVPTNVIFMPKAYLAALARDRNFYNSKNPAPSMCRNARSPHQAAVMAATCGVLLAVLVGFISHDWTPGVVSLCVDPGEYGLTKKDILDWMRHESWEVLRPVCEFWGVDRNKYSDAVLECVYLVDGKKYAGDVGQAYEDELLREDMINIHSVPLNASPLHYGGAVMPGNSAKFSSEENSNRKAFGQPIAAHDPKQNPLHPCNAFLGPNAKTPDQKRLAPGFLPVNLLTSILTIENGKFRVNEGYTARYLSTSCFHAYRNGKKTAVPCAKEAATPGAAADHDTMQRRLASNAGTLPGYSPRPHSAHSSDAADALSGQEGKISIFDMLAHIFSHSDSPGAKARTFGFMCLFVLTFGCFGSSSIEREYNDVLQKQHNDSGGHGHRESGGQSHGVEGEQHEYSSVFDDSHSEQHRGKHHGHGRGLE